MKSKFFRKLNQKGLSHNLIILLVAVVVLVGASGFFVWQRQKDSGIDAKAAGLVAIAAGNTTAPKYIKMYACKNPSKLGGGYYMVSFGGQRFTTSTSAYRIKKNGATWTTVYFNGATYAYPSSALSAYYTDTISMFYFTTASTAEQTYGSIKVSSIPSC